MKKEMRKRFREILSAMPVEDIQARSSAAAKKLFECGAYRRAKSIMVFLSLPAEIDTTPVVLRAWQDHKRVLAPRISWQQRRLLPIEIRSLTENLVESTFGVYEPVAGLPVPVSTIDLVIVPGLGFDEFGNRLGRGRGFYDQFLSGEDFRGVACALAFESQVTATIPVGPLDRQVHMLVTDKKVRRYSRPERKPSK